MLRYNLGQDPFKYAAPSTNMSVSVEIGQTDDFTISAEIDKHTHFVTRTQHCYFSTATLFARSREYIL